MRPMQCERAGELIGAYLDHELDAATRRDVATHLATCPTCSAAADDLGRLSRKVAAIGREPAPERLSSSVAALITGAAIDPTAPRRFAALAQWHVPAWLRQAAALVLVCAVTAVITALVVARTAGIVTIERDVVTAHVRSLLQESPTQVASSDAHTIKPWFAGRLDFAPAVKDLTSVGFPLSGARLDYIGERRVAALVYRRRLHVVNVFVWPSADGSSSAPRESLHRGYNLIAWSSAGIMYCAISDLNMSELRELPGHL